jgi:hypothetical protein
MQCSKYRLKESGNATHQHPVITTRSLNLRTTPLNEMISQWRMMLKLMLSQSELYSIQA